jgi:tetratricopeptide (TPR) repeat protein
MPEVLLRVRAVLTNRLWRVAFAGFSALCLGLLAFPVSQIPGYELSTGLGVLLAFFGGAFGIAFGRHESTRTVTAPLRQIAFSWLGACAVLSTPIVVTVGLATVLTVATSPCSPFELMHFVPVIVLPSVALVAAVGVLLGLVLRRAAKLVGAWLLVVFASAVHTTWPIVSGPQVFAYNHLAGFLPGPLYDEELHLPAALLWFRLGSLILTALALSLAALWVDASKRRWRRVSFGLLVALVVLDWSGPSLGFRMTDEVLEARLGGRTETAHVVLIHPAGMTTKEVARVSADLEFRFSQIAAFIGGAPDGKVRVWWYRSEAQKQALVGAARTQFAKPWRREIHVDEDAFPHPVVKHELAHALLAPLGAPPFGITATGLGLIPHVGIIEGLAVAADNPVDDLSLQEWAAAMKRQAILPDVRRSLGLAGFYEQSGARAYTTAGAFLRWLGDTRGPDTLKALYRDGDFARVYGEDLSALATRWEAFLDTVPLEPDAVNQAFARFRRGSLFQRPCAREVARLSTTVSTLSSDDVPAALGVLERCQTLQPEEPAHVLVRASLLRRLGRDDEAHALLEALLDRVKDAPSSWAETALALAEVLLARGDEIRARSLLDAVVDKQVSPAMDRTARIRRLGLDAPSPLREAVGEFFSNRGQSVQVHALSTALAQVPGDPLLSYLLGRRLFLADAHPEALPLLDRAAHAALPASVKKEALRLAIEAAFGAGRCDDVVRFADDARAVSAVFAARAHDWVERCQSLRATAPAPTQRAP